MTVSSPSPSLTPTRPASSSPPQWGTPRMQAVNSHRGLIHVSCSSEASGSPVSSFSGTAFYSADKRRVMETSSLHGLHGLSRGASSSNGDAGSSSSTSWRFLPSAVNNYVVLHDPPPPETGSNVFPSIPEDESINIIPKFDSFSSEA